MTKKTAPTPTEVTPPGRGGSYVMDPRTGEQARVMDTPVAPATPATPPELPPVSPPASPEET